MYLDHFLEIHQRIIHIINDMNVIKSTRYNIRNCKGFKKLVASLVADKMSRQSYRSNSCDCIAEDVKSEL